MIVFSILAFMAVLPGKHFCSYGISSTYCRDQYGLMLANFVALPHFSVSPARGRSLVVMSQQRSSHSDARLHRQSRRTRTNWAFRLEQQDERLLRVECPPTAKSLPAPHGDF